MLIDIDFTLFKKALKFKRAGERTEIYDPVRKKYLVLQPEELVRQLVVQYLTTEKKYPLSKMRVEMGLRVNEVSKRCDILIYDKNFEPLLLVECKSIHVPIDQSVFEQIAQYNLKFQVPLLVVTNGLVTYCCGMNLDKTQWIFLNNIPINDEL